jgi:hypothetical protein
VKQSFERKLEEAERDYERHRDAFERTLENRARKEYPELKYPLHNSKQIAEMTEIARLTRDADLLRHMRSYTEIDRPADREGQVREVGSLWRDHVEALLEVLERADMLMQVTIRPRVSPATAQSGAASGAVHPPFDRDHEIVKGWLYGGWTAEQMRDMLPCFETEAAGLHASRYLKAREFFIATGEALAGWREGDLRFAAWPALEEPHLDRISHLVGREGARTSERERALLLDLTASARSEGKLSLRETTRLLELSLAVDAGREIEVNRPSGARGDHKVFRPHDDEWAGRLAGQLILIEMEALALAASGDSRNRFDALQEDVYTKRALMDLTRSVRAASGMARDVSAGVTDPVGERALDRHLQVIADGLRSRGDGWKEWQVVGVGEFKHILPKRERDRAGRAIEEANARLETERRAESLERLEPQLESAAQFCVRAAYRDEGLEVMRGPGRLNDHVRELAERFSQVACDAGHDPERLGLGGRELEERAGRALSEAVVRFGREERDSHDLGRLEARMVLACAVRNEAATRQQRFADHTHFHEWNYETLDGRGSTSLCEIWLAYNEETDPAARLVPHNAEQHIVRSINEVHARLTEAEATHSGEAEAATRAYEARAGELSSRGVTARGPVFEPGELTRLEEAAVITRDHELIALVARCEEEMYGAEHAAARAMGRALRAVAMVHAEYSLPERFEHPVAAGRLERLPGQVRDSLSELLDRHGAAREAERGAALSFREGLYAQARERAGEASRTPPGAIRPLLTEAEACGIFGRVLAMNTHERRSWERMTMHAKVAVEADGPQKSLPSLHEWARQNTTASSRRSEYQRGIGDATVLSHREARANIRQQEKELGRGRPTPSRGR